MINTALFKYEVLTLLFEHVCDGSYRERIITALVPALPVHASS